jgi:ubiquinone/menaquinone biosynthesis C-methylase UbiE
MAFDVGGGSYQRFMGRFSEKLSAPFADFAGVTAGSGMRVVDVGCGPGALTSLLVDRLGARAVAGVDPSETFLEAVRERLPDVDIQKAPAEALPFDDVAFDAALAQLVVHFMNDPKAGVGEMARVTRPGCASGTTPEGAGRYPRSGQRSAKSTPARVTKRRWSGLPVASSRTCSSRVVWTKSSVAR